MLKEIVECYWEFRLKVGGVIFFVGGLCFVAWWLLKLSLKAVILGIIFIRLGMSFYRWAERKLYKSDGIISFLGGFCLIVWGLLKPSSHSLHAVVLGILVMLSGMLLFRSAKKSFDF